MTSNPAPALVAAEGEMRLRSVESRPAGEAQDTGVELRARERQVLAVARAVGAADRGDLAKVMKEDRALVLECLWIASAARER